MKKFAALLVALIMSLSLCFACAPASEGEKDAKPEKVKDGAITIDLDEKDSVTLSVSDYVRTNGTNPDYAIRYESEAIEVSDVDGGTFTIEAKAVCADVPVSLDVSLKEALQFTVTVTVTVIDSAPSLKGTATNPLTINIDEESTLTVDLLDYVEVSASDVTFTATTTSEEMTVSVSGSTLTIQATHIGERQEITVKVFRGGEECLEFTLYVNITDSKVRPEKIADPNLVLYLQEARYAELDLSEYVNENGLTGLVYRFNRGENAEKLIVKSTEGGYDLLASDEDLYNFSIDVLLEEEVLLTLEGSLTATGVFPANPANNTFEAGNSDGWMGTGDYAEGNFASNTLKYWEGLDGSVGANGLPFGQEGEWFLDMAYADGNRMGTLTSSLFKLGENGWVSFMLGGGVSIHQAYMSFIMIGADGSELEIARFGNTQFKDAWPWILDDSGVKETAYTLQPYKYHFDANYAGAICYIRLVDAQNGFFYAGLTVDSIYTTLAEEPAGNAAMNRIVRYDRTQLTNELVNGNFETGDLTGWTVYGNNQINWQNYVSNETTYWGSLDYFKEGTYHFGCWMMDGENSCSYTYTMRSSAFVLGGNGHVSFRLGNGRSNDGNYADRMYITVWKYVEDGEDVEIARFNNYKWEDPGRNIGMWQYYADLSDYLGEVLYFEITDLSQGDNWAGICVDDFRTFYEDETIPDGFRAGYLTFATGETRYY